ncbi:hypothetical protein J2S05_001300 [Alkalicoccobacillus murimartini]|uniref:Uncharacterized protein n=1 Tax=Alkalicoccobacillus murimartini TaxID=171685 RepID=A0ABT9YFA6_9BACI|nr:hypothetical protein [Alkalicoccobacillus murimartini]
MYTLVCTAQGKTLKDSNSQQVKTFLSLDDAEHLMKKLNANTTPSHTWSIHKIETSNL